MSKAFAKIKNLSLLITIVLFIVLYVVGIGSFKGFNQPQVFLNLLIDNAHLIIASIGITFVLIAAGIDISIASTLAFTGMMSAFLLQQGMSAALVILVVLSIGIGFGVFQGVLINNFYLQPFIITLAGQFLMRGMCSVVSTASIAIEDETFRWLSQFKIEFSFLSTGQKTPPFITISVVIALVVLVVCWYILKNTKFGRCVYAVGGNEYSARLMGMPVGKTKIIVYTISSFCAALAGVVYSFYTLSGYGLQNIGLELDAISSAVIGGTLLTGGVGTVVGTFMGVLIQGLIQVMIIFQGTLSSWWTKVVIAALLCIFIMLQQFIFISSQRIGGKKTKH